MAPDFIPPPYDPERLPIAVYGTLLEGCGNDRIWHGRADVVDAQLLGLSLWAYHAGFPYARLEDGQVTQGQVIFPHPECYDEVLARLDILEGVPRHYRRTTIGAQLRDVPGRPEVTTWVYVETRPEHGGVRVPGNCWRTGIVEGIRL